MSEMSRHDSAPAIRCLIPWSFIFIQEHAQKVFICPYHKYPIGALDESTLEDIWNGSTVLQIRQSLLDGQIPKFCWDYSAACPLIFDEELAGPVGDVSDHIIVGENDRRQLGKGWYALEHIPDSVRWTSATAEFRINTELKSHLCLEAMACKPDIVEEPIHIAVELNGINLGAFRFDKIAWYSLRFPLAPTNDGACCIGRIIVNNPWIPAQLAGNGDTRRLGIAVRRIWTE